MTVAEQTEHVHESELELYLKDQLSRESLATIDAHLRSCQACSGKLAEQDKCLWYLAELSSNENYGNGERRRHPRLATDDPASLQVLNPFSDDAWEVRIVDVSRSGLRTLTTKRLLPGSLVKVKMQYSVACGDVRYCIPADNGFYAGIRLHDYFVPKA
ncbi:MAG: PilZ domain-containing protein [Acidobacteriia bacterium]|nr:PilZ domain-containing protein [Terriglobia bacterium]